MNNKIKCFCERLNIVISLLNIIISIKNFEILNIVGILINVLS